MRLHVGSRPPYTKPRDRRVSWRARLLSRTTQENIWVILWAARLFVAALRVSLRPVRRSGPYQDRAGDNRAAPGLPVGRAAAPGGALAARDFVPVSEPGLGDHWNTYPWSMQWWRDALYVGTNRAFPCIEYYLMHSRFPWLQRYPPRLEADLPCAPCAYDLPLQAEIWRYTPVDGRWERVYQSPQDVGIPAAPGVCIARDIGFRNMQLFSEPDGTEALYVAGVSGRTIAPGAPPPRLLRSTDGRRFEPVPAAPGSTLGDLAAIGFRAMACYKRRLYVVAGGLYGAGIVLEAADPAAGNDAFRMVSPADLRVNEMAVFNGFLYVGLRHPLKGYAVMKTDATGAPPYRFHTVVAFGAGRRVLPSHCVLCMHVYGGRLYVGTSNPAEVLCIDPDDRWHLVVGKPRKTPWGRAYPLSGLGDGFGDPLNCNISRMHDHDGWLYIGTFNVASKQRKIPIIGKRVQAHRGFDLFATRDGVRFHAVTRDGCGDAGNTVRTLASTPLGLFLGANEEQYGARIYLGSRS